MLQGSKEWQSVFHSCFLSLSFSRIRTNLLIILLKGSHVLTGLRKLSFLHALTHIPVNKGTLCIHQVKLVLQVSPGLSDGCGVAHHAHGSLCFGQVSTRYHGRRLVINANLEASGAQYTNWMPHLVLMAAMAAVTSTGTTSPQHK